MDGSPVAMGNIRYPLRPASGGHLLRHPFPAIGSLIRMIDA